MAHYLDGTGLTTLWTKIKALIPTSLKNPNALTLQANGTTVVSYDGSSAKTVNVTPANIGAAAASHTHSYLPLSGGSIVGAVDVDGEITCSDSIYTTQLSINTPLDTTYIFKVGGKGYISQGLAVGGTTSLYNLSVSTNTTLSQSCTFSKSEARFGVNGSYTDPYNGQAAGFKFGGSIAATYGYFYNDVKAKNIIVNGGNLSFIVNGTTYKLNMSKAVTLGLVTT